MPNPAFDIMDKRMNDLTNKKFGRWTVLSFGGRTATRDRVWNCRCECGTEKLVRGGHLTSGRSPSCGCVSKERNTAKFTTHGMFGRPIYRLWAAMIARCENKKVACYPRYGGRGIRVCPEWHSFEAFYADMGERPPGKSLDRIDNDGPYCKANCRWATATEQALNTRRSKKS